MYLLFSSTIAVLNGLPLAAVNTVLTSSTLIPLIIATVAIAASVSIVFLILYNLLSDLQIFLINNAF